MPSDLTPAQRSLQAAIAAHESWANTNDRAERTRKAREASPQHVRYWERAVDPDGTLTPKVRQQRAESAYKAHMSRLSLKAAKARRRNARQRADAPAAARTAKRARRAARSAD